MGQNETTTGNNTAAAAVNDAAAAAAKDAARQRGVVTLAALRSDDYGSIACDAVATLAKSINKDYAKEMRALKDADRKADAAELVRARTLRRTVAGIDALINRLSDDLNTLRDVLTLLDSGKMAAKRTTFNDHAYRVLGLVVSKGELAALCDADAAHLAKTIPAAPAAGADAEDAD